LQFLNEKNHANFIFNQHFVQKWLENKEIIDENEIIKKKNGTFLNF
jgi:hypothetical protein